MDLPATSLNGLTNDQIQSEMNSLRNLRRRSLSQLDPDIDLPGSARSPPVPPSPTLSSPPTSPSEAVDLPFTHGFQRGPSSLPAASSSPDSDTPLPLSDLMWLPAHLHPDVAPQEFRAFLAEQTKPEALMRRSGSLDRRRSMLSKQVSATSDSETELPEQSPTSPVLKSSGSLSRRRDPLENLTIADLQKLEQLAVKAVEEGDKGDENKELFRDLLTRSISTGPTTAALDVDSQPLVQAPGGLIRRTARTKIRKPSLAGDGGGHRFGPSRRDRLRKGSVDDEPVSPLERSSSITDSDELHGEIDSGPSTPDKSPTKLRSPTFDYPPREVPPPPREPPPLISVPPGLGRDMSPHLQAPIPRPPRAPSPGTEDRPAVPFEQPPRPVTPPVAPPISLAPPVSSSPTPSAVPKKSGWARLVSRSSAQRQEEGMLDDDASDASSVSSKKSQKSVFGGLFRSKAKEEGVRDLDFSTAQVMVSPTASGMLRRDGKYTNFYRLPLHVERAIYRLSHIKLSNPRRALYEQVLISNLMLWYLSVINRPTQPPREEPPPPRQASPPLPVPSSDPPPPLQKRPERSAPPTIREPIARHRGDVGFEVLHRATASVPPSGSRRDGGESAWLSTWPKSARTPSPVSGEDFR